MEIIHGQVPVESENDFAFGVEGKLLNSGNSLESGNRFMVKKCTYS